MLLPHCILVNEIIAFVPIKQNSNFIIKKNIYLFHGDLGKTISINIAGGFEFLNKIFIISPITN